jgi:hypothetical protein
VLHALPLVGTDIVLIFGRYRRQSGVLFSPLQFKVLLALENIPAHVWSLETTQAVVGFSYLIYDTSLAMVDVSDIFAYWAATWATHPDLILAEVGCVFLELEEVIVDRAPSLFIPASDIIYSKRDTL